MVVTEGNFCIYFLILCFDVIVIDNPSQIEKVSKTIPLHDSSNLVVAVSGAINKANNNGRLVQTVNREGAGIALHLCDRRKPDQTCSGIPASYENIICSHVTMFALIPQGADAIHSFVLNRFRAIVRRFFCLPLTISLPTPRRSF